VIYAAASRALCALEVLANANELAGDYIATPIELPDDLAVTSLSIDSLPSDWDAAHATTGTADIGTAWAERLETVVLVVPSAIIALEQNYILNPRHPDFSRVRFLTPEPFQFDDRLRRAWLKR
jgi:RES domain-containing protein